MKRIVTPVLVIIIWSCNSGDNGKTKPVIIPTPVDKGWTFELTPVWSDEFDYEGKPDPSKWGYDLGGQGWGNNELQNYTDELKNASVSGGKLSITAILDPDLGYTSARVVSRNKGDFVFGRVEFRAKLPNGRGTWPALWMLPTDWAYGDWPKSGEIDIMEHVGYEQNIIHISVHTEAYNHTIGTQFTRQKEVPGVSTDFHLYRIDWTPYAIRGYVDDEKLFEFINQGSSYQTWPFDRRFHLLMNLAVGGNWGGAQGVDTEIWPQTMEVDYIRVYKMLEQ